MKIQPHKKISFPSADNPRELYITQGENELVFPQGVYREYSYTAAGSGEVRTWSIFGNAPDFINFDGASGTISGKFDFDFKFFGYRDNLMFLVGSDVDLDPFLLGSGTFRFWTLESGVLPTSLVLNVDTGNLSGVIDSAFGIKFFGYDSNLFFPTGQSVNAAPITVGDGDVLSWTLTSGVLPNRIQLDPLSGAIVGYAEGYFTPTDFSYQFDMSTLKNVLTLKWEPLNSFSTAGVSKEVDGEWVYLGGVSENGFFLDDNYVSEAGAISNDVSYLYPMKQSSDNYRILFQHKDNRISEIFVKATVPDIDLGLSVELQDSGGDYHDMHFSWNDISLSEIDSLRIYMRTVGDYELIAEVGKFETSFTVPWTLVGDEGGYQFIFEFIIGANSLMPLGGVVHQGPKIIRGPAYEHNGVEYEHDGHTVIFFGEVGAGHFFKANENLDVEVAVVGGGGGPSKHVYYYTPGGGGAVETATLSLATGTYPIRVGAGGATAFSTVDAPNGGYSEAFGTIANGGQGGRANGTGGNSGNGNLGSYPATSTSTGGGGGAGQEAGTGTTWASERRPGHGIYIGYFTGTSYGESGYFGSGGSGINMNSESGYINNVIGGGANYFRRAINNSGGGGGDYSVGATPKIRNGGSGAVFVRFIKR